MPINKLKNAWISTDTTIDGVDSFVNEGKTKLKNNVVVDTKLAVGKTIDNVNNYSLDVTGGDINFNSNNIMNVNNLQVSTINGATPSITTPNLNSVLTAGNTTTVNINMNNRNIQNCGYVQTNIIKPTTANGDIRFDTDIDANSNQLINTGRISQVPLVGTQNEFKKSNFTEILLNGVPVTSGGGGSFNGTMESNLDMNSYDIINNNSIQTNNITIGDGGSGDLNLNGDLNIIPLTTSTIYGNTLLLDNFGLNNVNGMNMSLDSQINANYSTIINVSELNFDGNKLINMNNGTINNIASLTGTGNVSFNTTGHLKLNPTDTLEIDGKIVQSSITTNTQNEFKKSNFTDIVYNEWLLINDLRTIDSLIGNITITFPISQIWNIINNGTLNVFLPDLSLLPTGGAGSYVYILRGNNTSTVNLKAHIGQQIKLMDNSLVSTFVFNSTISNMLLLMFTRVGNTYRWVQVSPLLSSNISTVSGTVQSSQLQNIGSGVEISTLSETGNPNIDVPTLYVDNIFNSVNTFNAGIQSFGSTYVENFTFSNVSSDIILTNWNASTPTYTSNNYYAQYVGTSSYIGTGFTTSLNSGGSYVLYITRGTGVNPFYLSNFPAGVTSNQCFTLQAAQNSSMKFILDEVILDAGEYVFGFWCQNSNNTGGNIGLSSVNIKNNVTSGIIESISNINPIASYPNWLFYTIPFSLPTNTNIVFEFVTTVATHIYGGYINLVGFELTKNSSIVINDQTTNKVANVGANQSMLNNVFIKEGLNVQSGGALVTGGLSTNTSYGTNNLSINSSMASKNTANASNNNFGIGANSLNALTSGSNNIAIGNNAFNAGQTNQRCISIGHNNSIPNTKTGAVSIGNNNNCRGSYTVVVGDNEQTSANAGVISDYSVSIGADSVGCSVYNGYGVLSSVHSVGIGYKTLTSCADNYNVGVGSQSFQNMNGVNGITQNGNSGLTTQNNTGLGYKSGFSQYLYNNCLFLGAYADATVNNLYNACAIGYNAKVDSSNCIQLGGSTNEKVKITGDLIVTTINGSPYTGGGNSQGITIEQVQANANIFTALQTFNNGLRLGERAESLTGANLDLTSNFHYYCGTKLCIINANANTYQIILPNPSNFSGSVTSICNRTNFKFTLSCSGVNFLGRYGSQIATHVVYPHQEIELYANQANWLIDGVKGVPYSERFYSTVNQSIANNAGGGTIVQLPTLDTNDITTATGIDTWGGKGLTYYASAGTNPQYSFGNNTGYTMVVHVDAQIQYATNATGVRALWIGQGSGIGATTAGRYSQTPNMMSGPTSGFPGGAGYTRASATVTLQPNDYIILYTFQNSGAALNINNATANNRGNITFTRIG